jgi:tetratricopeptide (TPR) repeat protein
MSVATMTGHDRTLAAPVEAIPVDPIAPLPDAGRVQADVSERTKLKASLREFRGREVEDPDALEAQQTAQGLVQGRVDQARALFEAAPTSLVAGSRYAHTLLLAGQVEQAVDVAAASLELERNDCAADNAALFVAARVLASANHSSRAEAALAELPANGPWALLRAGLAEQRGDLVEAMARVEESENADALAYRGYLLVRQGRAQEALHLLRASQHAGGANPILLVNQAYAYALLGSLKKAVRAARQATVMAPHDLTASFNLTNYLRTSGQPDLALAELARISGEVGHHALIASARADVLLSVGRSREALRELRRATHHTDDEPDTYRQAELRANIAVLEWVSGKTDRLACLKAVMKEIEAVGAQISLATIVADLSTTRTQVRVVERLVSELATSHSEIDLLPVTSRLAYLKGDYAHAAELSLRWAESAPLDVHAARAAVVQVGQALGEYSRAGDLGLALVRRMPHDTMLANNTAFVLALAGRPLEAERLLNSVPVDSPFVAATRGLIEIAKGNVEAGLLGYDLAEEIARRRDERTEEVETFVAMLRAQEAIVIYHFGLADSAVVPEQWKQFTVPGDWASDARFLPYASIARRLGAPWPSE